MIEWLNEPYEWSPLTITTTLRTNKTPITDKTLRGEESEKKKYLFITSKLWKDYLV